MQVMELGSAMAVPSNPATATNTYRNEKTMSNESLTIVFKAPGVDNYEVDNPSRNTVENIYAALLDERPLDFHTENGERVIIPHHAVNHIRYSPGTNTAQSNNSGLSL